MVGISHCKIIYHIKVFFICVTEIVLLLLDTSVITFIFFQNCKEIIFYQNLVAEIMDLAKIKQQLTEEINVDELYQNQRWNRDARGRP
jgi:preprotein translocase subunit SecB